MQSDELIEKLKDAQKRYGAPLPVVMLLPGGSGDVTTVQIVINSITNQAELWLAEDV
jgi:hypothetical protein